MMMKDTKVKWVTAAGVHGSGITISDEALAYSGDAKPLVGHVLVAVDAPPGEEHRVIWCAVTWLTQPAYIPTSGSGNNP